MSQLKTIHVFWDHLSGGNPPEPFGICAVVRNWRGYARQARISNASQEEMGPAFARAADEI